MTGPVFRWSGEYFGFVHKDFLFSKEGLYLGWVDRDGLVWRANGRYLGELMEANYVMRREDLPDEELWAKRTPPLPPAGPPPVEMWAGTGPRVSREPLGGWLDVLAILAGQIAGATTAGAPSCVEGPPCGEPPPCEEAQPYAESRPYAETPTCGEAPSHAEQTGTVPGPEPEAGMKPETGPQSDAGPEPASWPAPQPEQGPEFGRECSPASPTPAEGPPESGVPNQPENNNEPARKPNPRSDPAFWYPVPRPKRNDGP